MNKRLLFVFVVLTAVSLACNFLTNLAPTGNKSPGAANGSTPEPNSSAPAGDLSAESTAQGGVLLKWKPISGVDKYLLEVKIGDEFFELARLPAGQTSYEHPNVPSAMEITYRLSTITGTQTADSQQVNFETPPAKTNPFQVKIEFDQAPAALTIDPNNFDPSTIDPNNFDPSLYMAQNLQTQTIIGPDGGELLLTGSSGVIYTLTVPKDALQFDVPITLKSISAIPNLPLSGGLMAAVFIEPSTLVFDIPATLSMVLPQGAPAPAGPLSMAFSFQEDGANFHLYPLDGSAGQSSQGARLARLAAVSGPPNLANILYGGGYGKGSGTAQDVSALNDHLSPNSQIRTEHAAAVSQLDDLTPLLPKSVVDFGLIAEAILQKASKANDWSKFGEVMDDFSTLINAGGDKSDFNNNINVKILDILIEKAQALLKKNKSECLTYDDFKAQELVERLTNPKSRFSKILSDRYKQKYGQKLLDDLAFGQKACTFELSMQSKETLSGFDQTITATASAPKMKLFLIYNRGEIFLSGGGEMSLKVKHDGICSFPIQQYDKLFLVIQKLSPSFSENGGALIDFGLARIYVVGWQQFSGVSAKGKECLTSLKLSGGGDYWTGLFTGARLSLGNMTMVGWKLTKGSVDGGSMKATWSSVVPSFSPLGLEGQMSEDTKFILTVTRNSR